MATRVKKLTASEKQTISKTAGKGLKYLTGKKPTKDEIGFILQTAQGLKTADKNFGKEAVALWVAKMNYAIANGDKKTVRGLIRSGGPEALRTATRLGTVSRIGTMPSTQLWDSNGGCSCGGTGPASW